MKKRKKKYTENVASKLKKYMKLKYSKEQMK